MFPRYLILKVMSHDGARIICHSFSTLVGIMGIFKLAKASAVIRFKRWETGMKWYQFALICMTIYDAHCCDEAPWKQGIFCMIIAIICFYYGV